MKSIFAALLCFAVSLYGEDPPPVINVEIHGAVLKEGEFTLGKGSCLRDLLRKSKLGEFARTGNIVILRRVGKDGPYNFVHQVDFRKLSDENKFLLRNGDKIYVLQKTY